MHTFFPRPAWRLLLLFFVFSFARLSAQWTPMASFGGEDVSQVLIVDTTWLSVAASGVYRSADDGLSWTLSLAFDPNTYGNSLAHRSADHSIWLLSKEIGIRRSLDAGLSWQAVQPGFDFGNSYPNPSLATDNFLFYRNYREIYRLDPASPAAPQLVRSCKVNPSTGNTPELAARGNDLWLATNDSLLRSTDSGDSWSLVYLSPADIFTFDLHDDVLLLSTATGMVRSDDYGASWQAATPVPANNFLQWSGGRWFCNSYNAGFWCSDDEGLSWQLCSAVFSAGYQAYDVEKKGNTLLLLGGNEIARSGDNGLTWELRTSGMQAGDPSGLFGTAPAPYAVGDYLNVDANFSADEGATWFTPLQASTDPFTFPLGGNVVYYNGAYFAVDYNRKIYRSAGDLHHWTFVSGPFPTNTNQKLILNNGHFYRVEYSSTGKLMFETTDDGASWIPTGSLNAYTSPLVSANNWLFHWDKALGLFRSGDGGANWQSVGAGLGILADPFSFDLPNILAAGNLIFVYSDYALLVSTNEGLTFTQINHHLLDASGYTMGVDALSSDGLNIAVIATDGNVYYSVGPSDQWIKIIGNLPTAGLYYGNLAFYHDYLYVREPYDLYPMWRRALSSIQIAQVSGRVWRDDNNNGQQDAGEQPYAGAILQAGSASFATSAADGTYEMLADLNTDTLRVRLPVPWMASNPAFYQINTSANGRDFGLYFPPDITDLRVHQTNVSVFRPGFDEQIYVSYQNPGTATADGQLRFVAAGPLEFVAASPQADAVAGDTLIWNLPGLPAGSDEQVIVTVHTPVSTPIFSPVSTWAAITASYPDADPTNNEHLLQEIVVGSYDPNDKRSDHPQISPAQLASGEPIVYTVRFQNTGTYPADFVRITDLLDAAHLDVSTFRVLSSSHPCATKLSGAGSLEFLFSNIDLPPSDFNEPASHGFVQYEIRPKTNLPLGTNITNTAFIYFDFNPAIVTNTTKTTVSLPLPVQEPQLLGRLQINPNPAGNRVEITIDRAENGQLRISDAMGRVVLRQPWPAGSHWLDIGALAPGFYTVGWQSAGAWYSGKLVKQ